MNGIVVIGRERSQTRKVIPMKKVPPKAHRRSNACPRMIFSAAALCWAATEATAGSVLPNATYQSNMSGSGIAEVGGLPTPYAYAAATGGFEGNGASASVTYSLEVVAPHNQMVASVPLEIATFVRNEITGPLTVIYPPGAFYLAQASVSLGGQTLDLVSAEFGFTGPLAASSSKVSDVNVVLGTVYQLTVSATADASYIDATARAFADPMISFATQFPNGTPFDSTGFTLAFSGGIGNGPPGTDPPSTVPEPGSLTIFGVGALGLLGYGRRWRKLERFKTDIDH